MHTHTKGILNTMRKLASAALLAVGVLVGYVSASDVTATNSATSRVVTSVTATTNTSTPSQTAGSSREP